MLKILLAIALVLFLIGVCRSYSAMERNGRLDLMRRSPFTQHPLAVRFKMFAHPAVVPILLILLAWNGILNVITLGWSGRLLKRFIRAADAELQHYADVYWGGAPRGRMDATTSALLREAEREHDPDDEDVCSPVGSAASTLASDALAQAGLESSFSGFIKGVVQLAEDGKFCGASLGLSCKAIARRGYTDPMLVAKMAVGEMLGMVEREVERGNARLMHAQRACRRAFAELGVGSAAA